MIQAKARITSSKALNLKIQASGKGHAVMALRRGKAIRVRVVVVPLELMLRASIRTTAARFCTLISMPDIRGSHLKMM